MAMNEALMELERQECLCFLSGRDGTRGQPPVGKRVAASFWVFPVLRKRQQR